MNGEDTGSVAVALAGLKGSVDTGFATINGRLDVALQRTDTVERDIKELKRKMVLLETKMWKLMLTAAAVGTGGATGIFQLMN